jgi:replicative DNA helicase
MNTEFDNIILKKLTHSGEYFSKIMPILKADYFGDLGNQELFKLVKSYYGEYRQVPTLTELVGSVKNVSNAEVRKEIINSLHAINNTDEVQNVQYMLNETVVWVKDALYLQALQIGSDGLMNKDDDLKLKAQQLMDERSKISIDTDLGLDLDDIDAMIEYYSERNAGILTHHKELNKRLGPGFLPGTLSVILAASGIGKSLLMTDLISGMVKDGKNCLLVSLEMADKEIMKRVHANAMGLPVNSLLDLSKNEDEIAQILKSRSVIDKQQVLDAYHKMKKDNNCGKLFVKDYPSGSFSPLMLEQLVESYKIEQDIEFDIVFVDYIGIMKSDLLTPGAGLYSYVKSIAEETRSVAKKLGVSIVSASQLNRCFSIDTFINGANKLAGEINCGDVVNTIDNQNEVVNIAPVEKMQGYKIKLKSGKEIICSANHKFPTRHGTMTINVGLEPGIKLCSDINEKT